METQNCRICTEKLAPKYIFREMMLGMRHKFAYGECPNCGAIQILKVPCDIEKYYPPHYYSFNLNVPALKRQPFLKRLVGNLRINRKYKLSESHILDFLKPMRTMPRSKILDIGCGKGALICSMHNLGFERVEGVDKFIGNEYDYGNGVKVYKKDLAELKGNTYDLLMMHHVLEHMDSQVDELRECYRLLKKGGVLLICIPVLGASWETYKENWVQLDAPRHFVIHTLKSMALLAEKTGFSIGTTVFDSTAFQFWGSELYKKDIPLTLPGSHEFFPLDREFTTEQILKFNEDAKILNSIQKGDSARFYFYKN